MKRDGDKYVNKRLKSAPGSCQLSKHLVQYEKTSFAAVTYPPFLAFRVSINAFVRPPKW